MKNSELIKKLQQLPLDMEVCITDWRKNIHHADDEPQGHGIEPDFNIELVEESVNTPFIALSFKNDDYNADGTPDSGSSIYSSIEQDLKD